MFLRDLTTAERRTISIGGAIIISLVTAFRGLPAWTSWRIEARESAAVAMTEVARTRAMYEAFPVILDSLEAGIARLREMRPMPVAAGNPDDARAILIGTVQAAARAGSVQMNIIETGVDSTRTKILPVLYMVLDGAGDITGLATFLRELEGSPFALAIQGLSIVPQNVETPEHEIETLIFRLRVECLMLNTEAASRTTT
jgi:hypothetical protein